MTLRGNDVLLALGTDRPGCFLSVKHRGITILPILRPPAEPVIAAFALFPMILHCSGTWISTPPPEIIVWCRGMCACTQQHTASTRMYLGLASDMFILYILFLLTAC